MGTSRHTSKESHSGSTNEEPSPAEFVGDSAKQDDGDRSTSGPHDGEQTSIVAGP